MRNSFLSKYWWNYGHNMTFVFSWGLKLFLLFFVLSVIFFDTFINDVYTIENLKTKWDIEKSSKTLRRMWVRSYLSFLYACMIFFGVKLNVGTFKYTRLGFVYLLHFFYLSGLLCIICIGSYILFGP